MSHRSFLESNRWVLGPDEVELEEVPDELFMDIHDGTGTHFLARTCYGNAVVECQVIEDDYFLLKVRPELRHALFSELREAFHTSYVYRFVREPSRRILFTDLVFVQFRPLVSDDRRRICLREYFPDVEEGEGVREGIHRMDGEHSKEPILAWKALQLEGPIEEAFPVVVDLPEAREQPAEKDLKGAP